MMKHLVEAEIRELTIPMSDLPVTPARVERGMGYGDVKAPEQVVHLLEELLPLVHKAAKPRCSFRILHGEDVVIKKQFFDIDSVRFDVGGIIGTRLVESDSLALFVATSGPDLETLAYEAMEEQDLLKGYIIDSYATEIVEASADWLEQALKSEVADRGWNITNRYSPGYCGWHVSEQQKLFAFFPKGICGIQLTESSLMIPRKSVSGVIGVGRNSKREAYQCHVCEMEDCIRRVRE